VNSMQIIFVHYEENNEICILNSDSLTRHTLRIEKHKRRWAVKYHVGTSEEQKISTHNDFMEEKISKALIKLFKLTLHFIFIVFIAYCCL
jgi:hypothetical protein